LPLVEATFGIDPAACIQRKGLKLLIGEEFELGDADAVLAGDHAVKRTSPAP
jgi:hypothetical protein